MSQKSPPTYNPPAPVLAASGTDLYNQGQDWYQKNQPGLYNAQSTALSNANNPDYYSTFQPTSFEQALGNQYFQNVWPDESALIKQQFSQSGLSSSPALAETLGRAYGSLGTQVGSYLSDQGNTRATNSINAGLGISQSSLLNPFVTTAGNQSNMNTNNQNAYNQALAQQQYQQAYNKYAQSNALASTIGQISPFAGQVYGGATGTSGSAFGGSANTLSQIAPLMFSGMAGGFGGGSTMGSVNVPGMGSTSTGGMSFGADDGSRYSNTANIFSNGASSVY